ncbi:MAG: Asp-tRNA(Asn)/Glu-tRNA(Gln) amidotransferase subunit GatC [Bdellovibrionales bacterium]|nr:Asp-tRNA(Asn)/Glu-tRNA(Gln) amidotransferase subunit GatC [Bdellovibrionales bacterium]
MAEVNEAIIRKVADLARLDLKDQEIQEYVTSIGDILKHVDQLTSVKVDGVEPMYHGVDHGLRFREDKIVDFPSDENGEPKVLKNAPDVLHGGFKVPQVL